MHYIDKAYSCISPRSVRCGTGAAPARRCLLDHGYLTVRLRVKDLDFAYNQIVVRDGKGQKDHVTMLPQPVKTPLQEHLQSVKHLHTRDLEAGHGAVYLPDALERKYPHAHRDWGW